MSGSACDVCGGEAIGVCASALGPLSLAYCQTCADIGAEPYGLTVAMSALNGQHSIEAFAPWFHETLFATVVRAGKTAEEFWADVAAKSVEIDADLARAPT